MYLHAIGVCVCVCVHMHTLVHCLAGEGSYSNHILRGQQTGEESLLFYMHGVVVQVHDKIEHAHLSWIQNTMTS